MLNRAGLPVMTPRLALALELALALLLNHGCAVSGSARRHSGRALLETGATWGRDGAQVGPLAQPSHDAKHDTNYHESNVSVSIGRQRQEQLPRKPAVVFARYKEDMTWVKQVVKAARGAFTVHIYQSGSRREPNFVPNHGLEATKYLKYILDHYHALPPQVLFLHAHEKAGHNPCSPSTFLPRWRWDTAAPYVALPATMKSFPYRGFSDWDTIKWTDLLAWGQQLAGLPPRPYSAEAPLQLPMNAQFMVSREAIRQHPRELYERLYAAGQRPGCHPPPWMQARNPDRPFLARGCELNRLFGLAMEISWAAIMGARQPAIRWARGPRAGCFRVCNKKDGAVCMLS